ncbi:MAG: UDP-N-acetylmuramoyl-L-alanyl-D-glutamate--2,6-diaminopimelate ligase [Candidatus Hydrogenedentes bacterium]|nr:UDP-N-acetylmuramoyl-L-alanyl-D-glutamate--2,6-diaminopimelate ligase [Candidatus Hydrogenedentota bacterium]
MTLHDLPRLLGCKSVEALPLDIVKVTEDSRRVVPGAVFVAARGEKLDGHDFAPWAVSAGAIAVIGDRPVVQCAGVPYFSVPNPRQALGILAHALAGDPSRSMKVVGVTGTNGKSSTVLLTQHILNGSGASAACFGTIGYEIGGEHIPAPHTTPFGEDLADMFLRARDAGHTHVVMEVSSHALEQERVAGIDFAVGVFTNLTQDHLDYHKDMDSYRQAKLKLFERIEGEGRFTVVNREDPVSEHFIQASRVPCFTYGAKGNCRATGVKMSPAGTRFMANTPWGNAEIALNLVGRHNVSNALCAIAICGGLGVAVEKIAEGIASLERVPGRFERVDAGQDFSVIVDYAHTDDGLKNVLEAAREVCKGRVICVFGCGGDRDKGKRPKMGKVAGTLADFLIVTSDNPRSEDPERILLDIEVGVQNSGLKKYDDYLMVVERAEAIRTAIGMAKAGDLVMIAGKGHEDYQIIGKERRHFDDREIARDILKERW